MAKRFKVHAHSNTLIENKLGYSQPRLLRHLEIGCKEVRNRKPARCKTCHCLIGLNETMLKTIQSVKLLGIYYYNAYCGECYTELGNEQG